MTPIQIETPRLMIRPLREADYEDCARLMLEDTIFQWLKNDTLAQLAARAAWKEMTGPDILNGVLILKEEGFCGRICMQASTAPLPELGVALLRQYRGRGLGPEAVRAFANWFGGERGLGLIRVRIDPENAHSLHIFKKLGAQWQREGPPSDGNDKEPRSYLLRLPL